MPHYSDEYYHNIWLLEDETFSRNDLLLAPKHTIYKYNLTNQQAYEDNKQIKSDLIMC